MSSKDGKLLEQSEQLIKRGANSVKSGLSKKVGSVPVWAIVAGAVVIAGIVIAIVVSVRKNKGKTGGNKKKGKDNFIGGHESSMFGTYSGFVDQCPNYDVQLHVDKNCMRVLRVTDKTTKAVIEKTFATDADLHDFVQKQDYSKCPINLDGDECPRTPAKESQERNYNTGGWKDMTKEQKEACALCANISRESVQGPVANTCEPSNAEFMSREEWEKIYARKAT